ncbi:MAG: transporter substrate-binding domain-containing protein, partial [Gemmatimonadota bacterium]
MQRRKILGILFVGIAALVALSIACGDDGEPSPTPAEGETPAPEATEDEVTAGSHSQILGDVQDRGELICGVNDAVPGFGFVEADGTNSGFDTDFCRAIAAAVLDDPEAVQFVPLTAEARLTALQTGEIDVLIRNTTWTITRDAATGLSYAVTTFYDG